MTRKDRDVETVNVSLYIYLSIVYVGKLGPTEVNRIMKSPNKYKTYKAKITTHHKRKYPYGVKVVGFLIRSID